MAGSLSQQDLLIEVAKALERLGVEYMLTGSHVSSLQGEVRFTHDIDFVVSLRTEDVEPLLASFPEERFYTSKLAAQDAIRTQTMFNIIEFATGDKVDFWMLTNSPFNRSRFERRTRFEYHGHSIFASTPEDTILQKLRWCKDSGESERQFTDVLRVYEVQADLLDMPYIDKWIRELGVTELWQRVLDEAEPFAPEMNAP